MASRRRLLEHVVAAYDRDERPVSPEELAAVLGVDADRVRDCLAEFQTCALVVAVEEGYRPTTTARELLALDLDSDDLLIVDAGPADDEEGSCGDR